MLIILEGCDGAGKSTVAKKLAKILNARIIHCNAKSNNDYEFFSNIINASYTENIIADRFMYGQFVYQKPEDRHLTEQDLYRLETQVLSAKGAVINVTANQETIKDRLGLRGETIINGLTVKEVCNAYKILFKNSILPVQEWCTTEEEM